MVLSTLILLLTLSGTAHPQGAEKGGVYVSEIDNQLTLRKFTIVPVTDNLGGIYARPLESRIVELIQKDHHWEYVEAKVVGPVLTPSELEADSEHVKKIASQLGVDALFAAKATKGPEGATILLDLFLAYDGRLFAQEQMTRVTQFETRDLQNKMTDLYSKAVAKLPYQGLILSRSGTRVTLNLGARDGVTKDQIVTAVQIIKINRHPKFDFFISSEKEILGKIKLQKVDETLSFGAIVSEKEKGTIRKHSKISGVDFVNYTEAPGFKGYEGDAESLQKPGNKLAFGDKPEEWTPIRPATFGEVNLSLGLGSYLGNASIETGTVNRSYTSSPNPFLVSLRLSAELWITPHWLVEAELRQSVFTTANPRSGSTPANLNYSLNKYGLLIGYNFLIKDDFFGPKISLLAGFTQFSTYVDNTTPVVFVSSSYRGFNMGLKGSFPIDVEKVWKLGAKFNMVITPSLSETPFRYGDSSTNTMTSYSLFGSKRVGQRLEVTGSLDFELYSSSFTGSGTLPTAGERGINSSHRITVLSGGISYLF